MFSCKNELAPPSAKGPPPTHKLFGLIFKFLNLQTGAIEKELWTFTFVVKSRDPVCRHELETGQNNFRTNV